MDNDFVEIGIWIKVFFVCIIGLGSAIGFFFYFSGNALFTKASGAQASLQFSPNSLTARRGETVKVMVMVNTNKAEVRGVDVVAIFDPRVLMLRMVSPVSQNNTELKTFLPLDSSNSFDFSQVLAKANTEGRIEFSGITADITNNKIRKPVTGNFAFAELEFLVKKEMNTAVKIIKTHPTRDSTVVENSNPPLNILSLTNTLFILAPTPSPTP